MVSSLSQLAQVQSPDGARAARGGRGSDDDGDDGPDRPHDDERAQQGMGDWADDSYEDVEVETSADYALEGE